MGKEATFGISLSSPTAVAGTVVKGEIFANVVKEIRGAAWEVTLWGRERTQVEYQDSYEESDGSRSYRRREAKASRDLIRLQLPVNDVNNMFQEGNRILPGKYILPFEFDLPSSMPASFSISANGGHCIVEYSIKAILKGSGTLWNYNCEQFIPVRAKPLPVAPIPYNGPAVNEQVTSCCMNKGSMTFGAKLDDTSLDRNSTFSVSMSCRNNTTGRIQSVKAKFLQTVTWNALAHSSSTSKQLAALDFTQDLRDRLQPQKRLLARGESIKDEIATVFREVNEGSYQGQVMVPLDALNSYSGSLVQIQHKLIITVDTGRMRSNPQIVIPLKVGEPKAVGGGSEGSSAAPPSPASTTLPSGFSDQATQTATIQAPLTNATLGGPAKVYADEDEEIVLTPPPSASSSPNKSPPSMESLLKEMEESVADVDIIKDKMRNADWVNTLFQSLSATDYGKIIAKVDMDFDQPIVAEMLAENNISNFSCQYVVEAIRKSSEWNRPTMVERLLPYCKDLRENQGIIKAELTEWEIMSTERAFSNALDNART